MCPARKASLTRSRTEDLDTIFGKDNYKLAEDVQTLEKIVTIGRMGHEIFPWLMFLILIVVTLENFLANTFYKQAPETGEDDHEPVTSASPSIRSTDRLAVAQSVGPGSWPSR